MRHRMTLASLLVLAVATPAFGEDVAAILTAMPDEPAEERYLAQLCDRVGASIALYVRTADDATACAVNRDCSANTLVEKQDALAPVTRVTQQTDSDYVTAGNIFEAKRGRVPPVCSHRTEAGAKPITTAADKLAVALRDRNARAERRGDCRAKCVVYDDRRECYDACDEAR